MSSKYFFSLFLAAILLIVASAVAFSSPLFDDVEAGDHLVFLPIIRDGAPASQSTPTVTPTSASQGSPTNTPKPGGSPTATATSQTATATSPSSTPTASPTPTATSTPEVGPLARVAVASNGSQGNNASYRPSISGDGRYVAFDSFATNLVTGGTNGRRHIFVHDRQSGQTELVSVRGNGEQGNHDSANPSISADGRYVAFRSDASNLVANDSNGAADIFVHDRQTGQTALVSVSSGGAPGDQDSLWPSISDDGLLVAFYSHATNLVAGDANGVEDVFVRDLDAGTTTMVSVDGTGTQGNDSSVRPAISGNGRHVAFRSEATNLVDGDGNEVGDMFVHDLQTSHTSRVSIAAGGVEANGESDLPALSADGRLVAFSSEASNLGDNDTNGVADIFVYDTQLESIEVVSAAGDGTVGNGASDDATISDDGNLVAYDSLASNLVGGDTNGARDVFVHDLQSGATWRVSISNTNIQGNADSQEPALSGNGDAIAFYSYASNLVGNDTNGVADVFVYEGD